MPGYEIRRIDQAACLERSLAHLYWLEPDLCSGDAPDKRLSRLRYLVSAPEALAAFRLPFPPKPGLPGVAFAGAAEAG